MAEFVIVAQCDEVEQNWGTEVKMAGHEIALFREGDQFALENECPHQGAPLANGSIDDGVVMCPWHCWRFDAATGECLTAPGSRIESYPVRVQDGAVQVKIEA